MLDLRSLRCMTSELWLFFCKVRRLCQGIFKQNSISAWKSWLGLPYATFAGICPRTLASFKHSTTYVACSNNLINNIVSTSGYSPVPRRKCKGLMSGALCQLFLNFSSSLPVCFYRLLSSLLPRSSASIWAELSSSHLLWLNLCFSFILL